MDAESPLTLPSRVKPRGVSFKINPKERARIPLGKGKERTRKREKEELKTALRNDETLELLS